MNSNLLDSQGACSQGTRSQALSMRHLSLPLDRAELRTLRAGDACLLSGPLFTLRDAGHIRLLDELDQAQAVQGNAPQTQGAHAQAVPMSAPQIQIQDDQAEGAAQPHDVLPYGLSGQTIFYAGPTPAAAGRPFGAIGPTTASRMDFAAPALYRAGIVATIGKGSRSEAIHAACRETGSVYFVATGGAAAFLARCIESSQTLGYDDLGTEALRRIQVKDFPVFVGIDTCGNDIYSL